MFEFFKDNNSYDIIDRHITNVINCESLTVKSNESYSKFIISLDGTLITNLSTVLGSFAACVNDEFTYNGRGLIISTSGYRFEDQKIAMINNSGLQGDLSYIDGCSNSNLINPPRSGDPCVNYLYFPRGIEQTFHTHPSYRIGYIFGGSGEAHFKDENGIKVIPLEKGKTFNLERHAMHRFCTFDEPMWLVVFHPDSEDGPLDERNPMKTRTYLK